MAERISTKTQTGQEKKTIPTARLTSNDKKVMKRAKLLPTTPQKKKKEVEHERTN